MSTERVRVHQFGMIVFGMDLDTYQTDHVSDRKVTHQADRCPTWQGTTPLRKNHVYALFKMQYEAEAHTIGMGLAFSSP